MVTLLQEKYNQSLEEYQASPIASHEGAFRQGLNFGYYDALDLIRSQLLAFGYAVEPLEPIVPELGMRLEPKSPGEGMVGTELLANDWLDVDLPVLRRFAEALEQALQRILHT